VPVCAVVYRGCCLTAPGMWEKENRDALAGAVLVNWVSVRTSGVSSERSVRRGSGQKDPG